MANIPKDNGLSTDEACALYYFPEIPSAPENCRSSTSSPARFVGGAFNCNDEHAPSEADRLDSEQVHSLIEEALNKGLEQGRAETMAAQQETVDNAVAAFESSVKEMLHIRQRDLEEMETQVVRLALAIAKKIIGDEIEHGTLIAQVVKSAMEKVNDSRHLTLRLNPEDIDAVNAFKHELLPADDFGSAFRVEADEGIQRGGCMIETKLGDVDARIDKQIQIIEARLIEALPKRPVQGRD